MTQSQFNYLCNQAKELMAKTKDPVHDLSHVERVANNALEIKKLLPQDKQADLDDKILILAALWHDLSYVFYPAGFRQVFLENRRARHWACHYFRKAGLPEAEIDLLGDIIFHHVWIAFHFLNRKRSLYHQIVQDADTLEMVALERLVKARQKTSSSPYYFFLIKVLKPLFYSFFLNHRELFYNLSESIKAKDLNV